MRFQMLKRFAATFAASLGISAAGATAPPPDFPPKPKWHPTVQIDIDRTIKTFAYYVNGKKSFAVLEHGTCVILPPDAKDAQEEAAKIMHAILYAEPDMNLRPMDDGNWLVTYSQPAATVVFADVVASNWAYIDANH